MPLTPPKLYPFRLLAGLHIAADLNAQPKQLKDAITGEPIEVYPDKTYRAGQIVYSEMDLVEVFGEKFAYVGDNVPPQTQMAVGSDADFDETGGGGPRSRTPGDPSGKYMNQAQQQFPHGQVSTGFQMAVPSNQPEGQFTASGKPGATKIEAGTARPGNEDAEGAAGAETDYDSMKVEELRDFARANDINLKGASAKDDIIKEIKRAQRSGQAK
jgi:hypothetical protein